MTIKKTFETGCGYTKEDWDAVDSPPLTDEELARLKPAKEVLSASFLICSTRTLQTWVSTS
ncbi:hypothetical protein [Bartonella sp. MF74HXZ]|uniref:hypothetical protein n=1 Tax=Bartonella sp. MF74HXZ TaxID=1461006 RepID=UPI0035D0B5B6